MAKKTTLPKFARSLSDFRRKNITKALLPSMRKGISEVRKQTLQDIKGTSLGRALWAKGAKPSAKPPLVLQSVRARFSRSGGDHVVGLKLKGMAAIQEKGGKTLPHFIKPKKAKFLAFKKGGESIFAKRVKHPGSKLSRKPILRTRFNRGVPRIIDGAQRALTAFAAKVFR